MEINNILVVKLSAIGDVIHALPVSYALKETFPQAKVSWVVEPPAYDLLTNNPYIDEIILFEKKKFKSFGGLIKNLPSFSSLLKQKKYDVCLDLQGLGKSAAIAYLSGAKIKLGTCNMREGSHLISKKVCGENKDGHIVERYLDVARALGCKTREIKFPIVTTPKEEELTALIAKQVGMSLANPYVVLAVGANWPNKRWDPKLYSELVNYLYDQNITPVIIGGNSDQYLFEEIAKHSKIPPVNLVGKTTLKQLAVIIKNSKALIGGDTGPMHLAAGLGKPTIALMGPTDANRNGPYQQSENAIEINRDCKYCWKRSCSLGLDCLADIKVEQVITKLKKHL